MQRIELTLVGMATLSIVAGSLWLAWEIGLIRPRSALACLRSTAMVDSCR